MRAVRRLVAHQLSAGWRGWVVVALVIALVGGAVLTAAAGARRTASAYPRFLTVSRASDVLVSPGGSGLGGYDDALGRLPGVAAIAPIVGLNALPAGPGGKLAEQAVVSAPLDGRYGHLLEIPKLLAGRQPAPDRPGEVMVDQIAASELHLRLGSRLALAMMTGALSVSVTGTTEPRVTITPTTRSDSLRMCLVSVVMILFALVLALTALLVVGQVASRQLLAASPDNQTLAALGMTRGQLLAAYEAGAWD